MAYHSNVDTRAKVGFRPYHQTDPFGAAHLSGYGSGLGRPQNPFDEENWVLHGAGLGAYEFNRPFDPWELYTDTAPGLHGMGYLGDGSDPTSQAANELFNSGQITQAERDAILEGSMSFADVLGFDPTDQSSWYDAVGIVRQWNSDLQSLEQQYAQAAAQLRQTSGAGSGSPQFQQFGVDLISQRQQFSSITKPFIAIYTSVMGSTPAGLSGLGIAVVFWAVGAAAAIVAVYFGYQAFQRWHQGQDISQLAAQTAAAAQQSNAATNAQLTAALQRAQASGDTITAQTILATLQKTAPPPPGGTPMTQLEAWMTTNAKWIGLGVGALVVLPNLLGGRRR